MLWNFYFSIYLFVFRDSVAQPFPLTVQLNNVHVILLYRSISSAFVAQSFFPEQFVIIMLFRYISLPPIAIKIILHGKIL